MFTHTIARAELFPVNRPETDYSRTVVLNLGSIEPQGFVQSVSGVRQRSRIVKIIFNNTIFGGKGKNNHPQTFQNIFFLVLLVLFFEHSDFVCN